MKLFWLDLETTGLDPNICKILEVAVSEADFTSPWDAKPVYHAVLGYLYIPQAKLDLMDPFVVDMHTKNGLLAECKTSNLSTWDVAKQLACIIPEIEDKEERPILAGSTIGFDMSFLRVHMPAVAARFSHRLYDVSAIKLFCRSLGMTKVPKAEAHRAKDDVLESIAHGKLCAEWLAKR